MRINPKSKYHAKKTVVDGIRFDSKKEAHRYGELKLMERAKVIENLRLQPPFTLVPGFTYRGKKIRPLKYVADFMYYDTENDEIVVEDVKGMKTDLYKAKKKAFLYLYGDKYRFMET